MDLCGIWTQLCNDLMFVQYSRLDSVAFSTEKKQDIEFHLGEGYITSNAPINVVFH